MSSFTIHAIDDLLDSRLGEEAKKRKTSKNQLVKDLIAQSLGLPVRGNYADDYREFVGKWSVAEREVFYEGQSDNAKIDNEDWL